MDDQTEQKLRDRIVELEGQLRQAGRDVDDRFRNAVDPVGESARERLGIEPSRNWTIAIRVLVILIFVAVAFFVVRIFV